MVCGWIEFGVGKAEHSFGSEMAMRSFGRESLRGRIFFFSRVRLCLYICSRRFRSTPWGVK